MLSDNISCLCVTRGKPDFVRRALATFARQTHHYRELVMVSHDPAITEVRAPGVRPYHLPEPVETIGKQRDIALTLCRGDYVAVWDDDDFHAPTRLAEQLAMIRSSIAIKRGVKAVALAEVTILDESSGAVLKSCRRIWENTFFAERAALASVGYLDMQIDEDSEMVKRFLAEHGEESILPVSNAHRLYVYVKQPTGTLASHPDHQRRRTWQTILAVSSVLDAGESRFILERAHAA